MRGVCFFAHYDRHGIVADHVLYYLAALQRAGFRTVVMSAAVLSDAERAKAAPFCAEVHQRDNHGLDFGSWSDAFARHPVGAGVPVLLANDSVYGPLTDLGATIDQLLSNPADVHGMVASREISDHLQSWFIHLSAKVADAPEVRAFFRQDFGGLPKQDVILRGEIGFSQHLRELGFTLHAQHRGGDNVPFLPMDTNLSHFLWRELILEGIPFIKVELLRDNPMGIEHISLWRGIVAAHCPELVPMIDEHLNRVGRASDGPHDSLTPSLLRMERFFRRDYYYRRNGRRGARAVNALSWQLMRIVRHLFSRLRG